MTRDEAITALRKAQPRINTSENCSLWIDAFVALGMLKLDEPKNPEMHAGEIINEYVQDGGQTAAILMSLADAGLKIVAGYGYRSTGPSEKVGTGS